MTEHHDRPDTSGRVADALAYVCEHLDQIRDQFQGRVSAAGPVAAASGEQGRPGGDPLEGLLAAVGGGTDTTPLADLLDALHRVLLAEGDALGVYGHTRVANRGLTLPGIDDGAPVEIVYLCPAGLCSGRIPGPGTVFPLTCAITGQQLRRERL